MKANDKKPTLEEIYYRLCDEKIMNTDRHDIVMEAMQEYAELYHKEKLKEELMPCDKCRYDGLQQYPDTCQDCGGKEFSPLQ